MVVKFLLLIFYYPYKLQIIFCVIKSLSTLELTSGVYFSWNYLTKLCGVTISYTYLCIFLNSYILNGHFLLKYNLWNDLIL